MIRRNRGLIVIIIIVALSAAVLAIPEIRLSAFGSSVSRGDEDTFLGLTLGLDLQGGTHLVYRVIPEGGGTPSADDVEAIRRTIERRVNAFGVSEATVQTVGQPADRILVQIPGQKGASLNVNFRGGSVSPDALEDFFHTELARPDANVKQEDDGSLTVELDSIRPAELDDQGNVVTPGEADLWREPIENKFPATIQVVFLPTPVEDGGTPTPTPAPGETPSPTAVPASPTPEPTPAASPTAAAGQGEQPGATPSPTPEPETKVPSLEEVQKVFADLGFPDAVVTAQPDISEGFYEAKVVGLQQERRDEQDNTVFADVVRIREGLDDIGEIGYYAAGGDIVGWTVGGGVEEAKALIGATAQLEFRERICGPLNKPEGAEQWPPDGLTQEEWEARRCTDSRYYQEQATNINPDDLEDAFASTEPGLSRPVVTVVFNDEGAQAFFEVTDRIARNGDLLAIYLDGEELVAPSARQAISGGRAIIQGPDFTAERVRTIAIQLKAGALPATLELAQERNVDATLGEESLQKSLLAGGIGLALLFVFMTVYYKVPGLLASFALVMYTAVLLAIFKLIPVTLTLSGTAAIILSLGMAVDANILISERIKEELRTGRSLFAAINAGFDRAWPSIRDGNLTTVISAGVLFWFGDRFGTSIMQGFALTLAIGVLLSMFTAFFASRVLLRLAARTPLGGRIGLFVPVRDVPVEQQAGAN